MVREGDTQKLLWMVDKGEEKSVLVMLVWFVEGVNGLLDKL